MKFIKIKSSEQPTTPKPTTTLPDNMMYAWDPKANQWIAVMKDNPVVTPPTYNPNNVNNLNNTTQMYTPIKSTLIDSLNQFLDGDKYSREIKIEKGLISDGLIKLAGINPIKGPKYSITDKGLNLLKQAAENEFNDELKAKAEEEWNKYYPLFMKDLENRTITEENYPKDNSLAQDLKSHLETYIRIVNKIPKELRYAAAAAKRKMTKVKREWPYKGKTEEEIWDEIDRIQNEYNDKETEIQKGYSMELYIGDFFKDWMIENFIKKNSGTENIEKKSYLLDGIAESKIQTGTPEEQGQMPKFSIFEKDGSELAQIQAKNSTDAKVKFFMENPEYEGSQSIEVKEVKASKIFHVEYRYPSADEDTYFISIDDFEANTEEEALQLAEEKLIGADNFKVINKSYSNSTLYTKDSKPKYFYKNYYYDGEKLINEYTHEKEIDSAYGETTTQGLDFPNQSVSPSTDIKVDTKGWVNVQSAKLTPQLLSLGGILDPYIKNGSVGVSIEDENKGNISVRGDAKTINTIESKVRDLGIFCNNETLPADEGKGIYTLNIFLED